MKFLVRRWWYDEVEVTARSYEDAKEKAKWMESDPHLDHLDAVRS